MQTPASRTIAPIPLISIIALTLLISTLSGWAAPGTQPTLKVYNKGIGGQNSKAGRARFAKDVLALKPAYVFIYFGLNDTLNEPAFQTREQFIENITWMVDVARQAGIHPVLCTIHHVTEAPLYQRHKKESYGSEGPNGKIDRYNTALRALAKDKKVPLADFNTVVDQAVQESRIKNEKSNQAQTAKSGQSENTPDAVVSRDGVHLTPAGYALLARTFLKSVQKNLKGGETIVCLGDSVTFGTGVKGSGTTTGDTYPAVLSRLPLAQ